MPKWEDDKKKLMDAEWLANAHTTAAQNATQVNLKEHYQRVADATYRTIWESQRDKTETNRP